MTTMEDLTKTQIVLLTLLISFITSIATGIITTSLLAAAPAGVTQTIDRVIERTVERVSDEGNTVREVTIVKEGDAIVAAVEAGTRSVVRLQSGAGFYALGVIINKQGLVLTDKRDLVIAGGNYTATLPDGTAVSANVLASSESGPYVLFKLQAESSRLSALSPIALSKSDPKLGQTVIAIEGREKNIIAVGRTLSLDLASSRAITDIPPASETEGGPLVNLSGELIGLKTSNPDLTLPAGSYTIISPLAKFIAEHS